MAAAPAALAAAAKQSPAYTGAYSGALNNISKQEQAVRDVAARRQSDAQQYAAYVMGKQGSIAAAAHAADQGAVAQSVGLQGATLSAQNKIAQAFQGARAAQGLTGAAPAQATQPLVDQAQYSQALLGNYAQAAGQRANTNAGKAGFLAAAANANLLAAQRGIAGDAFNQQQQLEGQKTNLLVTKTQSAQADRRAQQAAIASAANAQLAHEDRMAALAQSGANAQLGAETRTQLAAQNLAAQAQQGHLARVERLKATKISAASGGGAVTPVQLAKRATSVKKLGDSLNQAVAAINAGKQQFAGLQKKNPALAAKTTPQAFIQTILDNEFKGLPLEATKLLLARAFASRTNKAPVASAQAAYNDLIRRIQSGELNYG